MPELPEVETIRRQLEPLIVGRRFVDAEAHASDKFRFASEAIGSTVESLGRRGKYLIGGLDDDRELIVHPGMTGSLRLRRPEHAGDRYVRAWWALSDGEVLEFRDVRRFGRIAVVPAGKYETLPTLATLGPEPWDEAFSAAHLWSSVKKSNRAIKTLLLSQRTVAGVGNIYADEALWLAGVHPASRSISRASAAALRDAIRLVLSDGLDHGGTTLRDYVDVAGETGSNQHHLRCYGRSGEPCERCGSLLRRSVIDARTSTWCPTCQRRR